MRTTINRIDGICKRIHGFSVGICILDRGLDANTLHVLFHVHNGVQVFPVAVQITDEGRNTAFEIESHLAIIALIHELDRNAARDECHLAETLEQSIKAVIEIIFLEDLRVKLERDLGPGVVSLGLPNDFYRSFWITAFITLKVDLPIQVHFHFTPLRERIDGADTHAMQTARDFIPASTKLTARVQGGHDHFQRRLFHLRVHPNRDASPVILH